MKRSPPSSATPRARRSPTARHPISRPGPTPAFGTPGTVAETRKIDDLDITFIRFANGVRLTVKPTKFRADQILVGVSLAGGELAMPKDRQILNVNAYLGGGLQAMPFIDIRRTLPGKIYGISFDVEDDAFTFSGATRPADMDTQMQVLAAFLTAPGWRPEYFQQGLRSLSDGLAKLDVNPMSLFGAKLSGYLHSNDIRWETPSLDDVAKARFEDVRAIIEPALSTSPIEVTIVGDISVEEATRSVAATLGALPRAAALAGPGAQGRRRQVPRPHRHARRALPSRTARSGRGRDRLAHDRRLRR